jgi:hypothetical protein
MISFRGEDESTELGKQFQTTFEKSFLRVYPTGLTEFEYISPASNTLSAIVMSIGRKYGKGVNSAMMDAKSWTAASITPSSFRYETKAWRRSEQMIPPDLYSELTSDPRFHA